MIKIKKYRHLALMVLSTCFFCQSTQAENTNTFTKHETYKKRVGVVNELLNLNLATTPASAWAANFNGKDMTAGWDVVVNYPLDQINAFMAANYTNGTIAKDIKFQLNFQDPITGSKSLLIFDLELAVPKLAFQVDGDASLQVPISSGSWQGFSPDGKTPLGAKQVWPDGYTIQITAPLAGLQAATGSIIDKGTSITFSDGKKDENHVIIHFASSKSSSKITPAPASTDPRGAVITIVGSQILRYFQGLDDINYAIASVNNNKPVSGETMLTPKEMVFNVFKDENSDAGSGTLSCFMNVTQFSTPTGNLSPNPWGAMTGEAADPVAPGYNAGIILSNNIWQQNVTQAAKVAGWSVSEWATTGAGVTTASMSSPNKVVAPGKNNQWIFGDEEYGGFDATLSDVRLAFAAGSFSTSWKPAAIVSEWSTFSAGAGTAVANWGKVTVTLSASTSPSALTLTQSELNIATIALGTINKSFEPYHCMWYEGTFGGCQCFAPGCTPSWYKSEMTINQPKDVSFGVPGLDFFATTNILAPGEHLMDVDEKVGVLTPKDWFIVGNWAKK